MAQKVMKQVNLDQDQDDFLRAESAKLGHPVSELIRVAIDLFAKLGARMRRKAVTEHGGRGGAWRRS